jgi:LysR family pca operon transcriptional activator
LFFDGHQHFDRLLSTCEERPVQSKVGKMGACALVAKPKQRHIDCFLEIVREGSIAAASDKLSMTQPAVSRTLADLEAILRARLMERTRSGITLTAAGETFLRYASASASALERGIVQIARSRRDSRQSVNVGVLPTVAARTLPEAIQRFKAKRPELPVRVMTGTNRSLTMLSTPW